MQPDWKKKATTRKDESGGTDERRKTINIPKPGQSIQTKQYIPKQQKIIPLVI